MHIFPRIMILALVATASTSTFAGVASDVGAIPAHDTVKTDKDWSGMLGLALLSAPEYISSGDTESSGAPIIIVDYKDTAYFKVNRGGYWFYKPSETFRVGALVKLRPGAWEDDDDSLEDLALARPASFDEPDAQAEAGVNFLVQSGKVEFEGQFLSGEDINVNLSLKYHLIRSKESTLTVAFEAESLGEDTVLYNWYGDDDAFDVNSSLDSATNTSLSLIGTYSLNAEWKLLYGVKATSLDDAIKDSPIGDEDNYNLGFLGAAWVF